MPADATVFSPGRINLIGEHIDYNDGVVLPAAIQMGLTVKMEKAEGNDIEVYNHNLKENKVFNLVDKHSEKDWTSYLHRTLGILAEKHGIKEHGLKIELSSTLPIGAGLSSSSALIVGLARAVANIWGIEVSTEDEITLAVLVEKGELGLNGGIMDQYAIVHGKDQNLLLLDCVSRQHEYIKPNLGNCAVYIINSKIKHELTDSGYNDRSAQASRIKSDLNLASYRDVNTENYESYAAIIMDETLKKRFKHIVSEQQRVYQMSECIASGDIQKANDLLYASHKSLQYDYEVSCPEIDFLVDTLKTRFNIGARIMGGGFGGSVIMIAPKNLNFQSEISSAYETKFGIKPEFFEIKLSQGLRSID